MSKEKNFSSRIQHKHDIESNWNKAVNFIPKDGEIIIYDTDENYSYPRIKIGNGSSFLSDLCFIDEIKADKNIVDSKITEMSFFEEVANQEGACYYSATVPNYILENGNLILASFNVSANYGHGTYLKINDSEFMPVGAPSDFAGIPVDDSYADTGWALYLYINKTFRLLFSTSDKTQLTYMRYLFQNYYNKYGMMRVDEVLEQFQYEWTQTLELLTQAFVSVMGDDFPEDGENMPTIRQIAEDVASTMLEKQQNYIQIITWEEND